MIKFEDIILNDSSEDTTDDIIQTIEYKIREHIINLDQEISDPDSYRKAFDVLRKAKKEDVVRIVINSPGGSVFSSIQFHNYLIKTKARTIAEVYCAYSAAADIALSCDEIQINEFSSMMIHSTSFETYGKVEEVVVHADYINKENKEIAMKLYQGFLTESEIQEMLKGKDFWFSKKDIQKRLKKWKPIRKIKK
jgi:ATP-dependent protease ClpP protease subunit